MAAGVYKTKKKDGTTYYRVSITYKNKHISLGSCECLDNARKRFSLATAILRHNKHLISDYDKTDQSLTFEKWVILMNFRNNHLYFKTPIYLHKNYFIYYLDQEIELFFDVDDLFFYSNHKIFKRGNYFFVNDYGMQMNILSRYGIRNYASRGKDYLFVDGNPYNFKYENMKIVNPYIGVEQIKHQGNITYKSKINLKGYVTIGHYKSINKAAIAYNKAVDFMIRYVTPNKKYSRNYIDSISKEEAEYYYTSIKLPPYLIGLANIHE